MSRGSRGWLFAAALRLVPRDWRDGVARDLLEEPASPWQLAWRAAAIGSRLRMARGRDALSPNRASAAPGDVRRSRGTFMRDFTRDLAFAARGDQIRPDFRLHEQPHSRPKPIQKARNRVGKIVREVATAYAISEEARTRFPAGWGHVGKQDAMRGILPLQGAHEGFGSPRLSHGHRVYPNDRTIRSQPVIAEALGYSSQVRRLSQGAPCEVP